MPTCSKKGNSCDNIHAATARDRIPEQVSCLVFRSHIMHQQRPYI